jgi:hypothetical protein
MRKKEREIRLVALERAAEYARICMQLGHHMTYDEIIEGAKIIERYLII